jgi:serine/threonine-protein kinase
MSNDQSASRFFPKKMTPELWQRIEQVYYAVLACPEPQRAAFLAQACAQDQALRHSVEQLLAANEQAGSFLATPAFEKEAQALSAEARSLLLDQQLGHYHVLAPLGAGGMGEVWLAEDLSLGRKVALKLLPLPFTQETARQQRFVREAKAASALNHPNIITIYEISEAPTSSGLLRFMATEFIEGMTLRQRLTNGRMEIPEALHLARQIGSALAAAHAAGIVHRDIKPENVMIRNDEIVKVLDFGLAKLAPLRIADCGLRNEEAEILPPDNPQSAIRNLPKPV